MSKQAVAGLLLCLSAPVLAADGDEEPPVVEGKDVFGDTIRTQTWDSGRQPIELRPYSTIAGRLYAWRYATEISQDSVEATLKCRVGSAGTIADPEIDCHYSCPDLDFPRCSLLLDGLIVREAFEWPALPRVSERRAEQVQRWVTAEFELDTGQRPPTVDFSQGEEAAAADILEDTNWASAIRYPARALRNEIGGRLILLCQVHPDHSVTCTTFDFQPNENAGYFTSEVPGMGLRMRAREVLADGRPTAGMRFYYPLSFAIPD